ncbi:MAG: BamA/TamA family outer membrane protein [Thermoanaerobaculia bacterium]|jgi:hypothetical protein
MSTSARHTRLVLATTLAFAFTASRLMAEEPASPSPKQNETLISRAVQSMESVRAVALPGVAESGSIATQCEPAPPDKDMREWFLAPIPMANATLGAGLALGAGYFFKPDADDEVSPPSLIGAGAFYFDSESSGVGVGTMLNLREDRIRVVGAALKATLRYGLFAGDKEDAHGVPIRQTVDGLLLSGLYRVHGDLFLGGRVYYSNVVTDLDSGEAEDVGIDPEELDSSIGAFGAIASYDNRDSQFFPLHGTKSELRADMNSSAMGSDFSYKRYELDTRWYHAVRERDVFAWQAYGCATAGKTPFYAQCQYGAGGTPRGYSVGRHFDETMLVAQAEYRWVVRPRWIVAAFGSIGGVAPQLGEIRGDALLAAGGGGIRWVVAPKNKLSLRVDYAVGEDDSGVYIAVGEAF